MSTGRSWSKLDPCHGAGDPQNGCTKLLLDIESEMRLLNTSGQSVANMFCTHESLMQFADKLSVALLTGGFAKVMREAGVGRAPYQARQGELQDAYERDNQRLPP